MSKRIIDVLELIEVEVERRKLLAGGKLLECLLKLFPKKRSIG